MSILGWIILGGIAGWVASLIMNKDGDLGIVGNIIVGIIGALIGGAIARVLGVGDPAVDFDLGSFVMAVIGSCILLWIVGAVRGSRRPV